MTERPALPLFRWQPPKSLLVFPADRWTGKARHVAAVLLRQRSDKARKRYWEETIDRMLGRLMEAGASEDDALAQIEPFRQAVQFELERREVSK